MTTPGPAPAVRVARALRLALLASLALNLTLGIGLIWLAKPAPLEKGMRPFIDARRLPKPDQLRQPFAESRRHLADAALELHRQGLHQRVDALWAAREQVYQAARSQPFQARNLEAAFAALRQAEAEAASHAHLLFLELMSKADANEREKLIEVIAPRSRHPHHRERGRRHERTARQHDNPPEHRPQQHNPTQPAPSDGQQ